MPKPKKGFEQGGYNRMITVQLLQQLELLHS